nr:MAG: polymerase [Wuhan tick virus 2]
MGVEPTMSQRQVSFAPHELIFDKKFDVALRLSQAEVVYAKLTSDNIDIDEKVLLRACRHAGIPRDIKSWRVNYHAFPEIYLSCISLPIASRADNHMMTVINVMSLVAECQIGWNFNCMKSSLQVSLSSYIQQMRDRVHSTHSIHKLVAVKKLLDDLVKKIPVVDGPRQREETQDDYIARVAKLSFFHSPQLGLSVAWSRRSCVIRTASGLTLLPRSYILLVHNKMMDILSVLVYAALCPPHIYSLDLLSITEKFVFEWMTLAQQFQQKFFDISKVWEGICIGESLYEVEGEGNREFLRTINSGLYEKTGFLYEGSHLRQLCRSAPLAVKHELSCLSKIAGHPFVDMELTAETLRMKVTEDKFINIGKVERAKLYATESFIREYRKREGKWPPVQFQPGANPSLIAARDQNKDPKNITHHKQYGAIRIADYALVNLLPCMEFDWVENFVPFIKDRTVSFLRDEVLKVYFPEDEEDSEGKYRPDWSQTRALLLYLLWPNDVTDHKEYMKQFVAGEWDLICPYLVIRLVPKEKEHKIAARAFGAKTAQDRARSIIQELNVAKFLDKYSDEHVMTQGELDVARKLLGFRMLKHAYQGHTMLIIQVDASSWNSRFRHASVAPIAQKVLDSVYNVEIFSKTQTGFEMSFIYMPDIAQNRKWQGQLGGIEGLQQYTWVFVYIHQIKVCMEEHPYPFFILCKGDDLRIAVMVPPLVLERTSIDSLKKTILTSLSEQAALMGHVLKVEDSYASECYFAYSKNTFINDVEMPQTYRKIQKCHGANNAFMSTIDDYIGTVFSNAHSASKTSPSPISCYLVAIFWSVLHLLERKDYQVLTEVEMAALLQVPNLLGGFPIIFLHNFFVRAESDLLPPFLELCDFAKVRSPAIGQTMIRFLHQSLDDPRKSFAGLMADPYSLPLVKPQAVSTIIRQDVTRLLQHIVRNEKVKQLFVLSKSNFDQRFLTVLFSADIWNVKLLSSCFNCGPGAIVAELIRKFESGRSIYNLLLIKRGRKFANRTLSKCLKAEKDLCDYRFQILRRRLKNSVFLDDYDQSTCTWRRAQHIREVTWRHQIHGVSQPCVQHQIMVGDADEFDPTDYTGYHHFTTYYDPPAPELEAPLFSIGKFTPFIGAVTGSGLGKPEAKIPVENVFTPKVRTLMQLYQWGHVTTECRGSVVQSNFPEVVKQLLEAYTRASVHDIMPFVGSTVYGRTIQHHVRASNYRQSIVPNTLLNIYTRVKTNRHSHHFLSQSPDHYLVNFLQINCIITSYIAFGLWMGRPTTRSNTLWAVTTTCKDCMTPIHEPAMTLSETCLPTLDLGDNFILGKQAIEEIAKAVEEFRPDDYYVADEEGLAVQEAESCLIQSAMNRAWNRHILLREETQHVLSAAGQAAIEGFQGRHKTPEEDECYGLVSLSSFLTDLAFKIYWDITSRYVSDHLEGHHTSIANTPPSELPWTHVLHGLDEHQRFNQFQKLARKTLRMSYSSVYDNPSTFAPIFGQKCYEQYMNVWRGKPLIANVSVSSDPRVKQDIVSRIYATRMSVLDKVFLAGALHVPGVDRIKKAAFTGMLVSPSELVFGARELTQDRITMRLFPFLDEVSEEIQALDVQFTEVRPGGDELYIEEYICVPQFTKMCIIRYGIPEEDVQSILALWSEDALDYAEAYQTFNSLIQDNLELTILRCNESTCLSKLRSAQRAYSQHPTVRLDVYDTVIPPLKPNSDFCKIRGFRTEQCFPHRIDPSSLQYELVKHPFSVMLNPRMMRRPLGAGNLSMSKLVYLLQQLGIKGLPTYSCIACLGDGYGGFCATFAALGDRTTTIVFNTKPSRVDSSPLCIIAYEIARRTGVRIIDHLTDQEYFDLTRETTCKRLEDLTSHYTIICCDAEIPAQLGETVLQTQERLNNHQKLLLNVCTLFLRKAIQGSILIMKVYATQASVWFPCVGLLGPSCTALYVIRSKAATSDGELYLIAQANFKCDCRYGQRPVYPPRNVEVSLDHYLSRYIRHCNEDTERVAQLDLTPTYPKLVRALLPRLPIYGWSKLEEVTKVLLPDRLHQCDTPNPQEWLNFVLDTMTNFSLDCYQEMMNIFTNVESEYYNTLTHCLVVGCRFLTFRAFMTVALLFLRGGQPILTMRIIEQHFLAAMREFPPRLGLNRNRLTDYLSEQQTGTIRVFGVDFSPIPYWMQGLRWAMSAIPPALISDPPDRGDHDVDE